MEIKKLKPDCEKLEPDAFDADGNLTINSWELFKEDELASDEDQFNKKIIAQLVNFDSYK